MSPPTFLGGKLNLKGSKKNAKKKKRKSSKAKLDKSNAASDGIHKEQKISDESIALHEDIDDDLTEAEKRALRFKKEQEERDFEKIGSKSHRERVEEFNTKLSELTELNDIPRVSAAGNG